MNWHEPNKKMKKTKETLQFSVGSKVRVKSLNLFGEVNGFTIAPNYVEYVILVKMGEKKRKLFFKGDELDAI